MTNDRKLKDAIKLFTSIQYISLNKIFIILHNCGKFIYSYP